MTSRLKKAPQDSSRAVKPRTGAGGRSRITPPNLGASRVTARRGGVPKRVPLGGMLESTLAILSTAPVWGLATFCVGKRKWPSLEPFAHPKIHKMRSRRAHLAAHPSLLESTLVKIFPTVEISSPRGGFRDRVALLLPPLLLREFGMVPLYSLMGLVPLSLRKLTKPCLWHGDIIFTK